MDIGKCELLKDTNGRCPAGNRIWMCCYCCQKYNECDAHCLNHPQKCGKYIIYTQTQKITQMKKRRKESQEEKIDEAKMMLKDHESGMTYSEIAVKYGIAPSTVSRKIKQIRACLNV